MYLLAVLFVIPLTINKLLFLIESVLTLTKFLFKYYRFVPVWSPIKPRKHGSENFPHLAEKPKKTTKRDFQRKKLDIRSINTRRHSR